MIDGLHLVFVELPKFKPHTLTEKKMKVLWLRYLTEIEDSTSEVAEELLDNPQISKALTVVEESAYTTEQLEGYDKFWDIIRTERTLVEGALRKGLAKGRAEGRAEGIAAGISLIAKNMKSLGFPVSEISKATGLTEEDINSL